MIASVAVALILGVGGGIVILARDGSGDDRGTGASSLAKGSNQASEAARLAAAAGCDEPIRRSITSRLHVQGPVTYDEQVPSGGDHSVITWPGGPTGEPAPMEMLVHSMEHGAIVLHHRPGISSAVREQLELIARSDPAWVISTPSLASGPDVAFTAWGISVICPSGANADPAVLGRAANAFAAENKNRAPESVALQSAPTPTGCPQARVPAERAPRARARPAMSIDRTATYLALLETSCGSIEIELLAAEAPVTVNNFVALARDGFYDRMLFHRVIDGFMIQGGDPLGDGTGGPGYEIDDENTTHPLDAAGFLAMANSGPDTGGSQFFITVAAADHLNGSGCPGAIGCHAVFGVVREGLDVIQRIASSPTDTHDRPRDDIVLISVSIIER